MESNTLSEGQFNFQLFWLRSGVSRFSSYLPLFFFSPALPFFPFLPPLAFVPLILPLPIPFDSSTSCFLFSFRSTHTHIE
ncbi:hypothetical protein J3E69DRAFT_345004 [Trichoderma sp. SZMC 28015]